MAAAMRGATRRPFLCGLLALAGLGTVQSPANSASGPRPLVYCADASPEGFDPALWDSSSTANATAPMFQGLVKLPRGGTAVQPQLATAWTVSPDATVFDFTLRDGVRFHTTPAFTPTRWMNADDVVFSLRRLVDPKLPFNVAFPATFAYPQSLGLVDMVAAVERVDDRHVRVRLHRPNVDFLLILAGSFAAVHSAEYAAQLLREGRAQAINTQPVGTGPWRFKSYRKDDVLRFVAHPAYWGAPQRTERLVFSISREPAVRVQKLVRNECQVTAPIRDVDLAALAGHPQVQVLRAQALNISYLAFNLRKPPLDRRAVREALDIAIDRDALFRVLFPRGDALQAVGAFPPSVPGFNRALKNEFDPERARRLLAEAGLADGFALELWALPISRPTNPNGALMAQLIQADWAKIGVKARIVSHEWGEYLKRANAGEHDVYMSGWSSNVAAADEFLTPNLSCANSRGGIKFCNAEFDALLAAARGETDTAKRLALYERAQAIFKRERPWITMAHASLYLPLRRDVKGFVMSSNGSVDFEGVWRE